MADNIIISALAKPRTRQSWPRGAPATTSSADTTPPISIQAFQSWQNLLLCPGNGTLSACSRSPSPAAKPSGQHPREPRRHAGFLFFLGISNISVTTTKRSETNPLADFNPFNPTSTSSGIHVPLDTGISVQPTGSENAPNTTAPRPYNHSCFKYSGQHKAPNCYKTPGHSNLCKL
ncbi:hypothetical protein Bbelb_391510 [Branchiostoma belcheri]|nr:hypothetical protein Bbelb_391510 [Branchiostoma belcheri]